MFAKVCHRIPTACRDTNDAYDFRVHSEVQCGVDTVTFVSAVSEHTSAKDCVFFFFDVLRHVRQFIKHYEVRPQSLI
jgi:hypothetical protein